MVRRLTTLPFLVMGAWTLTLGWLIADDRYQLFLAPKFEGLVIAGAVLSLVFAFGAAAGPATRVRDTLIKGLFLLLPVLFIFSSGEATLGNFALSKRGIPPVQTDQATEMPADETAPRSPVMAPDTVAETAANTEPAAESTAMVPVPISQLIRDWDVYEGKSVSIEGLFSETVVGHDDLSAVFRYLITCCAADAMPVGVFAARQRDLDLKNDDWVSISGRVTKIKLDGFEILFMEEAMIKKRPKPSQSAAYIFN